MNLTVDIFDPASVKSAVNAINAYKARVHEKLIETMKKMAEEGRLTAVDVFQVAVNTAQFKPEMPSVTVETVDANTVRIVASGKEVGFIELGTGVNHSDYPNDIYSRYPHGSYGKHHGANPYGWHWRGKLTDGEEPAEAMIWAIQVMCTRYTEIAREVFGSD